MNFHVFTHLFTLFPVSILHHCWSIYIWNCTSILVVMSLWIINQWSIVIRDCFQSGMLIRLFLKIWSKNDKDCGLRNGDHRAGSTILRHYLQWWINLSINPLLSLYSIFLWKPLCNYRQTIVVILGAISVNKLYK